MNQRFGQEMPRRRRWVNSTVVTSTAGPEFLYSDILPTAGSNGEPETPYRLLTTEGVSTVEVDGRTFLKVDPEASGNDRFVALDLLKHVNISAGGVLPMCQDTGTAIVMGKKSEGVLTG